MCGIAGCYYFKSLKNNHLNIKEILSKMKNRGPDHQGYFKSTKNKYLINFFSSRLSIIDLKKSSNMPFKYKNLTLVYNGEIYNYIELRNYLKSKKYTFQTNSDTEVLIKSFDYWGKDCVNHFEGMWAFSIFDSQKDQLFLSRDPFGEKPLYYYLDDSNFIFGSEIKFIFALKKDESLKKINSKYIQNYLGYGYKILNKSSETFFNKIKKFEPGTNLIINLNSNSYKKEKYFNIKKEFTVKKTNEKDKVNKVIELLEQSLKLRLRSDVPIAFCLSGGIDSGSLVSLAKKKFNLDPKCYSIIDKDKRYNEEKNIDYLKKKLNLNVKKIYIDKEKNFLSDLTKLIDYHDSPISTISYYAHSKISKAIKKDNFKVAISGTAADEIFSGYYDHYLYNLVDLKNKDLKLYNKEKKSWYYKIRPIVRNSYLKNLNNFIKNPLFNKHIYQNIKEGKKYFNFELKQNFFKQKNFSNSYLKNRMMNELFYESVPVILHEDDLNSMQNSIENRSPFLDKKLIKYLYSVDNNHFIKNGIAKNLLRESVKGFLPEKIRTNRKKIGFNLSFTSLEEFKNGKLKDYMMDNSSINMLINKDNLFKLLKQKLLTNTQSKILFSILNVQIFLENLKYER